MTRLGRIEMCYRSKALGTIVLDPNSLAGKIKRHREVETLLVTRDNRTEVMKKVLNWLR